MWGLCWEPPIHMDAIPQQTLMHYTKNVQTYTKHIQRIYKHYRKNVQIILKLIVYKLYVLSLIILDLYTDWKKCIYVAKILLLLKILKLSGQMNLDNF